MRLRDVAGFGLVMLLLAGCTSTRAEPPRATLTTTVTLSPSTTVTEATQDALPYWAGDESPVQDPGLEDERRLLGLDALYVNQTVTFYDHPRVGTLGSRCLVLVGWSTEYFESALADIPDVDVVVFRRYGLTEDRGELFFGGGDGPISEARAAVESQRERCT